MNHSFIMEFLYVVQGCRSYISILHVDFRHRNLACTGKTESESFYAKEYNT